MVTSANQLAKSGKFGDLRRRVVFLLLALVVYRIGAHIPVPGIDPVQLQQLFQGQSGGILNLFNITPDVRRTAHSLLIIYAVEIGVRNIPYVAICGIFRAGGDTKTGLKYDAICLYGIALPLVIVSAFWLKLPFLAVYVLMLLGEDLLKSYLCIRHYRGMSWIRPVVDVQKTA